MGSSAPRFTTLALLTAAAVAAGACTNHFDDLFASAGDAATGADGGDGGEAGTGEAGADASSEAGASCPGRAGLLALLPPSTGPTHHVDPAGSDTGPGTAARPWKTPQKAVDSLAPGETALVHAGVYADGVVWSRAGTASAPITLAGDPAKPAIFTGTFELRGAFTRVRGLVFDGALRTGTMFPLLAIRSDDVEITGSELRGAKRVGIESFVQGGVNPDRARIIGNWFHDGVQGIALHAGTGSLVASNLLTDNSDVGVLLDPSPLETAVLANTFARGRAGVVVGLAATASATGTRIVNNVIAEHTAAGVSGAAPGATNQARRNLFFSDSPDVSGTIVATDNVSGADPQFVGTGDFHLGPGSPALGAADLAFTPVIDRDGRCRPIGAPDLGAFEQ